MANVKWQCLIYFSVLTIVLACVSTAPAISQDAPLGQTNLEQTDSLEGTDSGLVEDAQWYAENYDVSFEEAVNRLELSLNEIPELESKLRTHNEQTFAGLWIEHEPTYTINVRFTEGGTQTVTPFIEGGPLEDIVEVESANYNLKELDEAHDRARFLVDGLGIPAESGTELQDNRVHIYVTDLTRVLTALQIANISLPDGVALKEVEELQTPQESIYGGRRLDRRNTNIFECTSGFSMVRANGDTGTSTAAHCYPGLDFKGIPINRQPDNSAYNGPYDVSFHLTPGITDVPVVADNDQTLRPIYEGKGRNDYPVGSLACHMGQGGAAVEYTCGFIRQIDFRPNSDEYNNPDDKFVRVDGEGRDISDAGDSGGPWLVANTALGIHSGGNRASRAFYMSVTYLDDDGPRDLNLVVRKASR